MTKLLLTPEERLDNMTIEDWFGPHFFETNFWYMWQTTFAFQKMEQSVRVPALYEPHDF